MRSVITHSEADTERLGEQLVAEYGGDAIFLLEGEMGCGKTVLVRGLGRSLGVDPRHVQSPTYSLIHEHQGAAGRLVHVDLYRLESHQVEALGLDEMLADPGVKAIEWAERLGDRAAELPNAVRVRIERGAQGERTVLITDRWTN